MIVAARALPTSAALQMVPRLRELALRSLGRMYRPQERLFAFRLRQTEAGPRLEGVSQRYTAIALIGLVNVAKSVARRVLAGHDPADVCDVLLDGLATTDDLGEVALGAWASRALAHPRAVEAAQRSAAMQPECKSYPTVEVAWSLAAMAAQADSPFDVALADAIAERLMASFKPESGLFPHWPRGADSSWGRCHVADFADQVYPILALSYYHTALSRPRAVDIAGACAQRLCELQGADGQWWWFYDVRTGRVIERYPVYAVHQDSMAPMALMALRDAGGQDYSEAVGRGLAWLDGSPEIAGPLIDEPASVIWRKVARREPRKLVRFAQAAVSRVHPRLRMPGMDLAFPAGRVDYETRPYHMGWILHAWPGEPDLTGGETQVNLDSEAQQGRPPIEPAKTRHDAGDNQGEINHPSGTTAEPTT